MRWLIALLFWGCDDPCERLEVADLEVCIDHAKTAAERTRGLIGHDLQNDEGLLLTFPVEGEVCLTNAGVPYPIDALWIDEGGVVVAIEHGLAAQAQGPWCHSPARHVLEVNGGVALGVEVGARVEGL